MPRKIASINELTDNASAMGRDYCPMCGAETIEGRERYSKTHSEVEILRSIAVCFNEDRTACLVLLVYVDNPVATVKEVSEALDMSTGAICRARQRAAKKYPSMAGILGLKTPASRAQQNRFKKAAAVAQPQPPIAGGLRRMPKRPAPA